MNRIRLVFLLFVVLGLVSCGGSGSETTSSGPSSDNPSSAVSPAEAQSTQLAEIPFEEGAIYLDRMYATSTGRYGPENALDGNPDTYWEAMPGAGTNEGIMLYFPQPVKVSKLRLTKGGQPGLGKVEVFANGGILQQMGMGEQINIGLELSSLFLRVAEMEGDATRGYYVDNGDGEVMDYDNGETASIGEIELYGNDGTLLKVRPLHLEPGKASATSTLAPAEAYSPDFLFDSRNEFGWAEGVEGNGEGQELSFQFDRELRIEKVKIWNGYQRSESHFTSNARAKGVQFGLEGGKSGEYQLKDEQKAQVIDLPEPLQGKSFSLKVNSVYPGAKYQDLVLSEMRFFDGQRWFALFSGQSDANKRALKEKVAGTALEKVLDHSLSDVTRYNYGNERRERSLLLRSNGSFVLYLSDYEMMDKKGREIRQVADGGWEIIELGKDKARLKIFGKIHRIRDKIDLYKGTSSSETTRIFNEFLNIDRNWVRGEKLVDSLRTHLLASDLVDCSRYAEVTQVDLRYATDENFMKTYLYSECLPCMLRNDAAEALAKAQKLLDEKSGGKYVFHIWDAYRPYSVQKMMWEKIKDPRYVADPYNGGSSHNKGAALDLTLALKGSKGGQTIPMGTDFDFFGEEAHHGYAGLGKEEKENRLLLRGAMEGAGFKALETEWWHYNFEAPGLRIIDVEQECDY